MRAGQRGLTGAVLAAVDRNLQAGRLLSQRPAFTTPKAYCLTMGDEKDVLT